MARHHRKSHRKHSRRSHKRRTHRRRTHRQRGGGSCAAFPANRASFAQAGGSLAPFVAAGGSDYLLDAPSRVQAEVGPLDAAFAELPSVIPRQGGGSMVTAGQGGGRRRSHRRRGRKSRRSHRRQSRRQRGGMYAFNGPSMLLDTAQYAKDGTNSQFHSEGEVNPGYGFFKGPQ